MPRTEEVPHRSQRGPQSGVTLWPSASNLGTRQRPLQPTQILPPSKQVHYLKGPIDLWCGLNHTLVLSQSGDFSKDLLGCGCGAGGRLPGWPKGSASFVRLHIKVRRGYY